MQSSRVLLGLVITQAALTVVRAQEANPSGAKPKHQRSESADGASDESAKQALREALRSLKADQDEASKPTQLGFRDFTKMELDEPRAKTLLLVGKALAKLGDVDSAQSACERMLDVASRISYFAEFDSQSVLYLEIASTQADAHDPEEATETLRQALRATRGIKKDNDIPRIGNNESDYDRSSALRQIAVVQRKVGDHAGARQTFAQAVEAAESVKDSSVRARALLEIADAEDPKGAEAIREKAIQFALSLDPFTKGVVIETILGLMIESGHSDMAVRLAKDRLAGDVKALAVRVIASALIEVEAPVRPELATSLRELADNVEFDRFSKRMDALSVLARLQAKVGDSDGAYRTIDSLKPEKRSEQSSTLYARIAVMRAIAQAQIEAGDKNAARNTLQVIQETVAPFGGGWEATYSLDQVAVLLAKAGDFSAAIALVKTFSSASQRASVLAQIASAQAGSGDQAAARQTFEKALKVTAGIPNELLWQTRGINAFGRKNSRMWRRYGLYASTNLSPLYGAIKTIAVAQANAGDIAEGIKTAKSIPAEAGGSERATTLHEIAVIQAKSGNFTAAVETMDLVPIQQREFHSGDTTVVEQIAQIQAKAGDAKGALAWALKRSSTREKYVALEGIAQGVIARKAPNDAK